MVVVGAGGIVSFFLQQMCHSSSQGLIQIILASDFFSGLAKSVSIKRGVSSASYKRYIRTSNIAIESPERSGWWTKVVHDSVLPPDSSAQSLGFVQSGGKPSAGPVIVLSSSSGSSKDYVVES